MPAVYNAANEIAVDAFCDGRIGYTDIWKTVGQVMDAHHLQGATDLDILIEADAAARVAAKKLCGEALA